MYRAACFQRSSVPEVLSIEAPRYFPRETRLLSCVKATSRQDYAKSQLSLLEEGLQPLEAPLLAAGLHELLALGEQKGDLPLVGLCICVAANAPQHVGADGRPLSHVHVSEELSKGEAAQCSDEMQKTKQQQQTRHMEGHIESASGSPPATPYK